MYHCAECLKVGKLRAYPTATGAFAMRLAISLILAGILAVGAFFLIMKAPNGPRSMPDFYPVPWGLIGAGLVILVLSFLHRDSPTWQFSCAVYASAMGWLAWRLAVMIDHTCPSGWVGFLSLAFLLSLRLPTAMHQLWSTKTWTDILRDMLLAAWFVLTVIATLIHPFTSHG